MEKKVRPNRLLQIVFPASVIDDLQDLASARGTNVSELVRQAVIEKYRLKVRA